MNNNDRLVYSTDPQPEPEEVQSAEEIPPHKQTARIEHDRKRRRGKTVTVISGLILAEPKRQDLAKLLKNRCGAGGTVKDNEIEIQGEHRDKVAQLLKELGYKVKLIGG